MKIRFTGVLATLIFVGVLTGIGEANNPMPMPDPDEVCQYDCGSPRFSGEGLLWALGLIALFVIGACWGNIKDAFRDDNKTRLDGDFGSNPSPSNITGTLPVKPDSTVFPVVEWMDVVDIASIDKELLRRLDDAIDNGNMHMGRGKVEARPNWVDSELNSNDPERSETSSKVWNSWKQLQSLKFKNNFTFERPKGRKQKKIYQLEIQLYELRDEYYKEVLDTEMSDGRRTEYRYKAVEILDSRMKLLDLLS